MGRHAVTEVATLEEFREAIASGRSVVVDYFADWCGPCRALAPVLDRVAKRHAPGLTVLKVDIEAAPELAQRAGVREVPALHLFREGRKVAVLTGFRPDAALERELERYGLIARGTEEHAALPGKSHAESGPGQARSWMARLRGLFGGAPDSEEPPAGEAAAPEGGLVSGTGTTFRPVGDAAGFDALVAASGAQSVVLFLHDPWCPISARAYREMERLGGEVALVDVSRAKRLNREIEARTGVRHESPQVLVLRHGRVTWHASHGRVTAAAVAGARAAAGQAETDHAGVGNA
ncbi:thioredoxin family protein [Tepidiforma sp.]|uniref:thioredoxin family protein n=1 Tax=Tepidiforma sp. TaxID=2682230 RepID=UPI002ADE5FAA|nr:thioredoxin family protein [Tepidiforma sp.]